MKDLLRDSGANRIFYNRVYEPALQKRDKQLECRLKSLHPSLTFSSFPGYLLYEPSKVDVPAGFHGGHWGTLMPYIRATRKLPTPARPLPAPPSPSISLRTARGFEKTLSSLTISEMKEHMLVDSTTGGKSRSSFRWGVKRDRCASKILEAWTRPEDGTDNPASEEAGQARLQHFLQKNLQNYEKWRSRADVYTKSMSGASAVSTLSPFLRWGQISCRTLFWAIKNMEASGRISSGKLKTFSRRLFWRDLAYFHFEAFPDMQSFPIRSHYSKHPWEGERDPNLLRSWQRGQTGYPIVDAAMRELWETGWMQQSVRMVAASFLVEYLGISWMRGREWFAETLIDEDLAINSMMWQNAGRSGIDQWNFILNPTSGAQDPAGTYVRRWIPELARLPKKYLHKPWEADVKLLRSCGVILGETYPNRVIVDLKKARSCTVEGLRLVRAAAPEFIDSAGYDVIVLPSGHRTRVFTRRELRNPRGTYKETESGNRVTKTVRKRRHGRANVKAQRTRNLCTTSNLDRSCRTSGSARESRVQWISNAHENDKTHGNAGESKLGQKNSAALKEGTSLKQMRVDEIFNRRLSADGHKSREPRV
eukprot:CAMPEP_0184487660 /NCGR_PEP_ID=MMETSP0113_2-20130426/10250_1 /TAXON_ID=91329 /ORGANISM="Norrisiella sphaerica, Strain BC52" /LENGTH=591 /DNA_ID=CAMNT_0026870031 /DNA_START=304 /DNA_END=2079 /DNA_ORIENTATION=+